MNRNGVLFWGAVLTTCVGVAVLLEAARHHPTVHTRMKLLWSGHAFGRVEDSRVSTGTRPEGCSEKTFETFNRGRPVYSGKKRVGLVTELGWFVPTGVKDGRQMVQTERRFIVTLTWLETAAIAFALASVFVIICASQIVRISGLQRVLFMSLVLLGLLSLAGISMGAYGIFVFKKAEWVPFNPDYGISMLTFFPAFRVPPARLLVFWDEWSMTAWAGVGIILAGTAFLTLRRRAWLLAFAAAYVSCVLLALCGIWIWQSSMMNWYEMWLM